MRRTRRARVVQWPVGLRLAALAVVASIWLVACQAANTGPIVYTAPPEVLARTFPPPSASPSPPASAAPTIAPDGSEAPVGSEAVARPSRGAIIFGTGAGADSCSILNPADVLVSTDPVFFAALLVDQMDGTKPIVLHVTKDGVTVLDHPQAAAGHPFDCYRSTTSIGPLAPGAYRFQVLVDTTLEAVGSVTVR
jgi:hypothetical protein